MLVSGLVLAVMNSALGVPNAGIIPFTLSKSLTTSPKNCVSGSGLPLVSIG